MKKQELFILFSFLLFPFSSFSQAIRITPPRLEFDGKQLSISYDILDHRRSDQFYVWLETVRENGEIINMKALSGDVGITRAGMNKQIIWIPATDSIFLNESVSVEVKAEKFEKSFNKGSMMLLSVALPGLGKTKLSSGKPYWLIGVAAYGSLAGGLVFHQSYLNSYDSYRVEEDPLKREELFNKAQKQKNVSGALIVSGLALWAADLLWVAATPNKNKPLKHVNLSLVQPDGPFKGAALISLRLNLR